MEESRRYARSVLSYTRKAHYLPTSILNLEVLEMEDFYSLALLMLGCILSHSVVSDSLQPHGL